MLEVREALEQQLGGHQLYHARNSDYETESAVPFRLAAEPLALTPEEYRDLEVLSIEVASFISAADQLYRENDNVKELLDRGKPDFYKSGRSSRHLFIRPDLVITEQGFVVCEIETSPFGLGLSHAINDAYRTAGFDTMTNGELPDHLARELPSNGSMVYSDKTAAYEGQLRYMVDNLFSADGKEWQLVKADEFDLDKNPGAVYRAFYLKEYDTDPKVREVVERSDINDDNEFIPSLTPHFEEKALMALIWDKRWDNFFKQELGQSSVEYLRTVIPKTFIVGEEEYFIPGMPGNATDIHGIAYLSRSKRNFVLKTSGYDEAGSWSEGVCLLQQKSRDRAAKLLARAVAETRSLQIVQEFHQGKKIPVVDEYSNQDHPLEVRVRLTPYVDPKSGNIISAKATGRSGTDFIHASTDSVNMPIAGR